MRRLPRPVVSPPRSARSSPPASTAHRNPGCECSAPRPQSARTRRRIRESPLPTARSACAHVNSFQPPRPYRGPGHLLTSSVGPRVSPYLTSDVPTRQSASPPRPKLSVATKSPSLEVVILSEAERDLLFVSCAGEAGSTRSRI